MLKHKTISAVLLIGLLLFMGLSLQAEEKDQNFTGSFMFGYRMVDTGGTYEKYREDINLEDGVRLFNFNLTYTPEQSFQKLFDRLDLSLNNFGGDPFETFSLSVQKFSKYSFKYNRRKSAYFYADQQEISGGHLYDMHSFDFDRITDSGALKVWLGKKADLYLNFDRYTKKGESITSYDINRIEYEFDKPIYEDNKVIAIGLDVHLERFSFVLEEKIQEYENSNSLFLPGYADGGSGARYPSSLDLFTLNQPYDLTTNTHTFKMNARPFDGLLIAGSAQLSDQTMDLKYSEETSGVNYLNRLYDTSSYGKGDFERKLQLYDLDITFLLTNKLAIISAIRFHNFDQEGTMSIDGQDQMSNWKYNTLGIEGGLQYQFSSKFAATLGYRYEGRELTDQETVNYEDKTRRDGFFGNLKWSPSRAFKLTFDHQMGSYDNPYTMISPTSFTRLKLTAKISARQFSLTGSFLYNKTESEVYDNLWESTRNQFNLRAGFHGEKVKFFTGYTYLFNKHDSDRLVAFPPGWTGSGTFLWDILYEGKANLLDGSLVYNVNEQCKLGGYFNYYSNTGFWEIKRTTFRTFVEYTFEMGLVGQIGWRYVDFKEELSGYNDYNANILELSFGYSWK